MKKQETNREEPIIPEQRNEVIVLVDHGAIELAEAKKDTFISPNDIKRLASARGRIRHAALITDEPRIYRGINPLSKEADTEKNTRLKSWTSAGFKTHICPRGPRTDQGEKYRTKEAIDTYLIDYASDMASLCKGRERDIRFIFVISDEDYLPLTRTLHAAGFSITIFITHECAFMDSVQAPHIEERLLMYKQGEPGTELHKLNASVHKVFGGLWSEYRLDAHQKRFLDRLTASTAICPECGERTEIGLWRTHACNPNHYRMVPVLQMENGPANHPSLPTEADIQLVVRYLESLGPRELIEWVLAQRACGTVPSMLALILGRMRAIPWQTVETALGIRAIGEEPMEMDEVEDILSEDARRIGGELDLFQVDEEEVCVAEGILDRLAELIREAEARSAYEHIARVVSAPTDGAFTQKEVSRIVFALNCDFTPSSAPNHRNDANAIMEWLLKAEVNDVIYWLTNRAGGDRTTAERSAVAAIVKGGLAHAVSDWVRTLRFMNTELLHDNNGLGIANEIAKQAGASMTPQAVQILLENGVLRHYTERDKYSRGHPGHPAFHLIAIGTNVA